MDAIKAQLLRIQQQVSGLSASQKMLTASLVALMVMSLFLWSRYAGTAEMEPVLDQALTPADVGQIRQSLASAGIKSEIVGDRVLVPSDQKFAAVAHLAYNNSLPSNSYAAWDEMLKQSTLWDSSSKTTSLTIHMKERLLSDLMTQNFPGVGAASVIINAVNERRVGGASLEPSASVIITTRGNEVNKRQLVTAASAAVASAVSGMTRSHVSIIIDGTTHNGQDVDNDFGGGDIDERSAAIERAKADVLREILPPGTLVAVSVDIDSTRRQEKKESYSAANSLIKEQSMNSQSQESSQPQMPSGDPGVVSNSSTPISANAAPAASGATNKTESEQTQMAIFPGKENVTLETPGGKATVVSAAVRIPRSYFARNMKSDSAKEVDDTAVQARISAELPKFRDLVLHSVNVKSEDAISVDVFYDNDAPMLASMAEASSTAGIGAMMGGHAKELALGALALLSLFMVSTIVKKGTPAPPVPVEIAPRETPRLGGSEDVAGIVGDNHATLDGMEMDEGAVRAQQMVEQVSTMVKENPDAAASLVKRWLNRT